MGIVEYHAFSKNVTFVTCCEILKLAFLLGDCFDAMRFLPSICYSTCLTPHMLYFKNFVLRLKDNGRDNRT